MSKFLETLCAPKDLGNPITPMVMLPIYIVTLLGWPLFVICSFPVEEFYSLDFECPSKVHLLKAWSKLLGCGGNF
jgi:hypothetical protein